MDIFASLLAERGPVKSYIEKNYGPIPRFHGARIMRYEEPITCEGEGAQSTMWAAMCGKDIIYIHTRCGGNNYESCGGKAWEESFGDKFLGSVNDNFDSTYRDHYFSAVIDDDYNNICKQIEEGTLI